MLDFLYESLMTLRPFNGVLSLVALVVCVFLLSSPGAAATVIGVGAKLGIFQHNKNLNESRVAAESQSADEASSAE